MGLTKDDRDGLNIALNEAAWLGIHVDLDRASAAVLVDVLTLPVDGPAPADTTVVLILDGVRRIAASLRDGWWNDQEAAVGPLALADLDPVVRSFGGCPIYGWDFIDPPPDGWAAWCDRLSLDVALCPDGEAEPAGHVMELFQEAQNGRPRHLDLRVWFGTLRITRRDGQPVPVQEFIDGGVCWWNGLHAGDPRTAGKGIVPGGPPAQS